MREDIKSILMYSTDWCADCFRAKAFFDKYNIEYQEVDVDRNEYAAEIVRQVNGGNRSVPTIIVKFNDESEEILVEPSFDEMAQVFLR